ncbi:hypothetical protein OROHE_016972 [Orobanche hederae]
MALLHGSSATMALLLSTVLLQPWLFFFLLLAPITDTGN